MHNLSTCMSFVFFLLYIFFYQKQNTLYEQNKIMVILWDTKSHINNKRFQYPDLRDLSLIVGFYDPAIDFFFLIFPGAYPYDIGYMSFWPKGKKIACKFFISLHFWHFTKVLVGIKLGEMMCIKAQRLLKELMSKV